MIYGTKNIKEIKREISRRAWRRVAASATQFFNLFKRINPESGSSLLVVVSTGVLLTSITSTFV